MSAGTRRLEVCCDICETFVVIDGEGITEALQNLRMHLQYGHGFNHDPMVTEARLAGCFLEAVEGIIEW